MENTNCKENCAFVKCGICETDEQCPNFIRSFWLVGNDPQPKEIKDCAPKKLSAQTNALEQRILSVQSVNEDVRNRLDNLETMLLQLMMQTKAFMQEKSDLKQLQNDNQLKLPEKLDESNY